MREHWRDQWQTPQTLQADEERAALKTLGLDAKEYASLDEIKARYQQLSQKYHPDKHLGDAEKAAAEVEFKRVSTAFASLRRGLPIDQMYVAIDPFGGVPWWHGCATDDARMIACHGMKVTTAS